MVPLHYSGRILPGAAAEGANASADSTGEAKEGEVYDADYTVEDENDDNK